VQAEGSSEAKTALASILVLQLFWMHRLEKTPDAQGWGPVAEESNEWSSLRSRMLKVKKTGAHEVCCVFGGEGRWDRAQREDGRAACPSAKMLHGAQARLLR
jgi:hypothetical protein